MRTEINKQYKFDAGWIQGKWIKPCFITVNSDDKIVSIVSRTEKNKPIDKEFNGYLIPGFVNAHSHSFQYAMAGLAEQFNNTGDDFWSWRKLMYMLASGLNPEQVYQIASLLFKRLIRNGYTHIAEFMYLHKDPKGKWYQTQTELGDQIISAAKSTGINICLIPIYYNQAGFGQKIDPSQKRFYIENVDTYHQLLANYKQRYKGESSVRIGKGIHSLRAANRADIVEILNEKREDNSPFHIHIAEQQKEVDECIEYYGARPIEWLLAQTELDGTCNLVHATHASKEELELLIERKVQVVICPSTEANLGDGFFEFGKFAALGGRWTIGTDSHIGLNPFEELRWLDYSARLQSQKRQSWYSEKIAQKWKNKADYMISESIATGFKSLGFLDSDLVVGNRFNGVVIRKNYETLPLSDLSKLPSKLCFSYNEEAIEATISHGKVVYEKSKADLSTVSDQKLIEQIKLYSRDL